MQLQIPLDAPGDSSFHVIYRPGHEYKFILHAGYELRTNICPPRKVSTDFVSLSPTGLLVLAKDYAWNGASGPAIDTVDFIRGSGAHDALYQLLSQGLLPLNYRKAADQLLMQIVLEDKMWKLRASWVYAGVRIAGRLYLKG